MEADSHYYRAAHTRLLDLGLAPHLLEDTLISSLFKVADRYRSRVDVAAIPPTVRWRATASELTTSR